MIKEDSSLLLQTRWGNCYIAELWSMWTKTKLNLTDFMGLSGQSTSEMNRDLVKKKINRNTQVNSLHGMENSQKQRKHFQVKILLRKKEQEKRITWQNLMSDWSNQSLKYMKKKPILAFKEINKDFQLPNCWRWCPNCMLHLLSSEQFEDIY